MQKLVSIWKYVQYIYILWKIQIKTAMRYHYIPTQNDKSPKHWHTKYWWGYGKQEYSSTAMGIQHGTATLKDILIVWYFFYFYKSKHTNTIWSINNIPWYLPKWIENICPTAVFFTIVKTWKQPKWPVDEWTNELIHPDNGMLLRAKKKRAIKPWKDRGET